MSITGYTWRELVWVWTRRHIRKSISQHFVAKGNAERVEAETHHLINILFVASHPQAVRHSRLCLEAKPIDLQYQQRVFERSI